jgi:uncharacterized phiE125 gp8 family phage protein
MPRALVTPPNAEPILVSEAKDHLRVTANDEDSLINLLITAARSWAEDFTQRALITQTWDYKLNAFADEMEIPLPPLQSVTSIKYIDTNGVEQTLAVTEYTVDTAAERGLVRLAYGKSWPAVRAQANVVTIRFVAGYPAAADVPGTIKAACLLILGELYARRENAIVGAPITVVPVSAEYLLWPYRSLRF